MTEVKSPFEKGGQRGSHRQTTKNQDTNACFLKLARCAQVWKRVHLQMLCKLFYPHPVCPSLWVLLPASLSLVFALMEEILFQKRKENPDRNLNNRCNGFINDLFLHTKIHVFKLNFHSWYLLHTRKYLWALVSRAANTLGWPASHCTYRAGH